MTFSLLAILFRTALTNLMHLAKQGTLLGVFNSDEVNLGLTCLLTDYFLKLVSLSRYSLDVYKLPFAQII